MINKETVVTDTDVGKLSNRNNYGLDLQDLGGPVWSAYDAFYNKLNGLIALSKEFDIVTKNKNYINLDNIIEVVKSDLAKSWGTPVASKLIPQLVDHWNQSYPEHNILKVNGTFVIII